MTIHNPEVLVVEDHNGIRRLITNVLGLEGYHVQDVVTLAEARRILARGTTDLLVLDLTLPDGDGLELLDETKQLPTIIITGRESEGERILGLRLGADDYMVKPFSPMELAARAEAVLRRTRAPHPERLTFGDLVIDPATREVSLAGAAVELTRKEFDLLAFLAEHSRQVFARDDLLRRVWGSDPAWQTSATVTEHVRRLRQKLEPDPAQPRWVVAVRGIGYRFDPPGATSRVPGARAARPAPVGASRHWQPAASPTGSGRPGGASRRGSPAHHRTQAPPPVSAPPTGDADEPVDGGREHHGRSA